MRDEFTEEVNNLLTKLEIPIPDPAAGPPFQLGGEIEKSRTSRKRRSVSRESSRPCARCRPQSATTRISITFCARRPRSSRRRVSASRRFATSRRARESPSPASTTTSATRRSCSTSSRAARSSSSSRSPNRGCRRPTDPEERLRLFIRSHLEYHMNNLAEMKVLVREADSLTGRYAADITRLKREYSRICRRLLEGLRRASQQNARSRAGANSHLAAVRRDELVLHVVRAGARLTNSAAASWTNVSA